jgi:hypothetical protein
MAEQPKPKIPGAKAASNDDLRFALAVALEPTLARDEAEREEAAQQGREAIAHVRRMRAKYASLAVSAVTIGMQD